MGRHDHSDLLFVITQGTLVTNFLHKLVKIGILQFWGTFELSD